MSYISDRNGTKKGYMNNIRERTITATAKTQQKI